MKKVLFPAVLLIGTLLLHGGEKLTAHWDFSKGIHSRCGKYRMNMRKNTVLAEDGQNGTFLRIHSDGKAPAGIIT